MKKVSTVLFILLFAIFTATAASAFEPGDEPDPTPGSIHMTPSGDRVFDTVWVGYEEPPVHIVTLSDPGGEAIEVITITLSNPGCFTLSVSQIESMQPGGEENFSISPKPGLTAGTHTTAVTVYTGGVAVHQFTLSFRVDTLRLAADSKLTIENGNATGLMARKNGYTAADIRAQFADAVAVTPVSTGNYGTGTVISKGDLSVMLILKGDLDGDGGIDARDYLMLKRTVLGTYQMKTAQRQAAKISDSEKLNAADYLQLKRHVLGTYNIYGLKTVRVMLDAGHYANYNRSPVVPAYWESRRMWVFHLMLKQELQSYGFYVGTTREDEEKDLGRMERGQMSEGYDLFLSLHSNANDSEIYDSVSVYHSYEDRNNTAVLGNLLGARIAQVMEIESGYRLLTRTDNFVDANGKPYIDENYGVLRGAKSVNCPLYYIIEHSYHTNRSSANWLLVDANLQKLAAAEAKVIADYYGMKK